MPPFTFPFLSKLVLLKYNHRGHREDINLQEVKRIFIPSVPSNCLTSLSLPLTDLHKKNHQPRFFPKPRSISGIHPVRFLRAFRAIITSSSTVEPIPQEPLPFAYFSGRRLFLSTQSISLRSLWFQIFPFHKNFDNTSKLALLFYPGFFYNETLAI
jgi:hypothetical protein